MGVIQFRESTPLRQKTPFSLLLGPRLPALVLVIIIHYRIPIRLQPENKIDYEDEGREPRADCFKLLTISFLGTRQFGRALFGQFAFEHQQRAGRAFGAADFGQ